MKINVGRDLKTGTKVHLRGDVLYTYIVAKIVSLGNGWEITYSAPSGQTLTYAADGTCLSGSNTFDIIEVL